MSYCTTQQRETSLLSSDQKSNRLVDACDSYSGGEIVKGSIVATVDETGGLDMRYQHVNSAGELMVSLLRSELRRSELSGLDHANQCV